ncbi:MAG: FKBP-type peptidyl-prolyl cis-trans isomerase [Tannerella sp.]|nr:FKBP-type peptidyl-prolyl cis-trans isomerase [Tannerella sp.]
MDSVSYTVGVIYGEGLKANLNTFPGGELNLRLLVEGFVNATIGDPSTLMINPNEAQAFVQAHIEEYTRKAAEAAKEAETRFLAENKSKEGVITTESGLQYKVLKLGEGDHPALTDKVTVHYTGKLLDGTVFDSSEERGEPATFGLSQVIPGWTELLQLMPLGSRYMAWIPSSLGYGERGAGERIKPYSTLIFEVELLGIEVVKPETESEGTDVQ